MPGTPAPLFKYRMIFEDEIKLVNWNGHDIRTRQVVLGYDTARKTRTGMLVTEVKLRDLQRRARNLGRGNLYIRANTDDYGEWETTLMDVRLSQVDDSVLWFHTDKAGSLNVLKKAKRAKRRK